MAYDNKPILRDSGGQAIPQVYDEIADAYQPALATNGRQHTILHDTSGSAIPLRDLLEGIRAAAEIAAQAAQRDLRGLIADRPQPQDALLGATYWALDRIGESDEMSVNTGSAWVDI